MAYFEQEICTTRDSVTKKVLFQELCTYTWSAGGFSNSSKCEPWGKQSSSQPLEPEPTPAAAVTPTSAATPSDGAPAVVNGRYIGVCSHGGLCLNQLLEAMIWTGRR